MLRFPREDQLCSTGEEGQFHINQIRHRNPENAPRRVYSMDLAEAVEQVPVSLRHQQIKHELMEYVHLYVKV